MLAPGAITGEWLAMVPLSAAIGAWIGQSRWRAGTSQFDRLGQRSRLVVWWSAARYVIPTVLGGQAAILAICAVACLVVNRRDGVDAATTMATVTGGVGHLVAYYGVLTGIALAGSILGFLAGSRWFTPALTLVVYVVQFLLMPTGLVSTSLAAPTIRTDEYTLCAGQRPVVCSRPADAPYLEAAASTARQVYDAPPVGDALPPRLLLTDTVGFVDGAAIVEGHTETDLALIGLDGHRSLTRDKHFSTFDLQNDIRTSLGVGCPLSMDQRIDIPALDDPSVDRAWARKYLGAIRRCDTDTVNSMAR